MILQYVKSLSTLSFTIQYLYLNGYKTVLSIVRPSSESSEGLTVWFKT